MFLSADYDGSPTFRMSTSYLGSERTPSNVGSPKLGNSTTSLSSDHILPDGNLVSEWA
jgi:hypothetical protein